MYNFPEYKEQDLQKIIRFMQEHPFVMLIDVCQDRQAALTPGGAIEVKKDVGVDEDESGSHTCSGLGAV